MFYIRNKNVYARTQYSYQDIAEIILRYSFYKNETHMQNFKKLSILT